MLIYVLRWRPSWISDRHKKHKICREPSNESMYYGGGRLGFPIDIKNIKFVENLPMIIPGQFGFNCPSGFREEAF